MAKIGIYPAAFDPIHNGHVAFAHTAIHEHGLDKVYFLPEPAPRHKQGVKALEHRVNMVHLAIANEPKFGVMSLDTSDFDIRHIWPRITSRFLGQELFMLIGNNPIKRIGVWPHTAEFGKQAPTFVIAKRSKSSKELEASIATLLKTRKLSLSYKILDVDYATYTAVDIRNTVKQGNRHEALMQPVYEYILRNKLYLSR